MTEDLTSDTRVVFMGFALDLPRRAQKGSYGTTVTMKQLLRMMSNDRRAGNDRLWVAPAHNRGVGDLLSYPAAMARDKAGPNGTTFTPGGDFPAVVGVKGATFTDPASDVATGDPLTNFFSPGGTPDLLVYGVSGMTSLSASTTDVRDQWYGTTNAFLEGGVAAAGYRPDSGGFDERNTGSYTQRLTTGTGGEAGPSVPAGTSVAAAEVASAAGIMMSKWWTQLGTLSSSGLRHSDRVAATIRQSARAEQPTITFTVTLPSGAQQTRTIPGLIDFKALLTGEP